LTEASVAVAMKNPNQASKILRFRLGTERAVGEGDFEAATDVIPHGQIFSKGFD
jgi:hypothetical protein